MRLQMGLCSHFIGLLLLLSNPVFSAQESEIDAAINRGLAWIMAHPATDQDGGFPDIVDEALFYLTIRRLGSVKTFDSSYVQSLDNCISRLEASLDVELQPEKQYRTSIEHYHLLLATHLIEVVRKPTVSHDSVVADAQRALESGRIENPTFRLAVAVFLQRLGARPQVSMDGLLDASLINRVAQRGSLPFSGQPPGRSLFRHPLAYYALVHEVAALTDFGRLPLSPWLLERRVHIGRILQQGTRRAMASSDIDLLAEILLCNHMLGLPMRGELALGADYLVAGQRADGSWGEQVTHRSNRVRHAVQTATAALLAYKTTRQVFDHAPAYGHTRDQGYDQLAGCRILLYRRAAGNMHMYDFTPGKLQVRFVYARRFIHEAAA